MNFAVERMTRRAESLIAAGEPVPVDLSTRLAELGVIVEELETRVKDAHRADFCVDL